MLKLRRMALMLALAALALLTACGGQEGVPAEPEQEPFTLTAALELPETLDPVKAGGTVTAHLFENLMAWGDGGVDENGQPLGATGNEIGLYHQLLEKDIESHTYVNDEQTTCRYTSTLEAGELDGKEISEMGLFDEEGDLIVYRNFLRKGKDADIPQIYNMDEIFLPVGS